MGRGVKRETRTKNQESRSESQEPRTEIQETRAKKQEPRNSIKRDPRSERTKAGESFQSYNL